MELIKILGTGCPKCQEVEKRVREVIHLNDLNARIIKVDHIEEILKYKVATTPAIVVDNRIVMEGRVPSLDELSSIFDFELTH